MWRDHYLFIRSSFHGHLYCFHLLAAVNGAAVNMPVRVCESQLLIHLGPGRFFFFVVVVVIYLQLHEEYYIY